MAIKKLWISYKGYVHNSIILENSSASRDIAFWRQELFKYSILYSLPVSFLASIPAIAIGLRSGSFFSVAIDILTVSLLAYFGLSKKLNVDSKKILVLMLIDAFALIIILNHGLNGPGTLYLFATTIFSVLIFSANVGYLTIAFHALIGVVLGLILYFKSFHFSYGYAFQIDTWLIEFSNLLFLSIIGVVLISKIINGLENTMLEELKLRENLDSEANERVALTVKLKESKGHYKSIFNQNPSPMWVMDAKSLQFLQVNDAAVDWYGYTKQEFLAMNIHDLQSNSKEHLNEHDLGRHLQSNLNPIYVTRHLKQDRESFDVEIRYNTIRVKGELAILAIARDITEQLKYNDAIKDQNRKLQEIAYIQSHMVRAPLASIMGLINIINMSSETVPDPDVISHLQTSAEELDQMIRAISRKL